MSHRLLKTVEGWSAFLRKYAATAAAVAESEGWDWSPPQFKSATPDQIAIAESVLQVELPSSIRTFYLTTNGWPADGWMHPEIHSVSSLKWLKDEDPHLFELALEAEQTPGPFRNDPDDLRLTEHRHEDGTRVTRSIALNSDTDDTGTILADPVTDRDEWQCGSWAHWNPGMSWRWNCFSDYMMHRYHRLVDIERSR